MIYQLPNNKIIELTIEQYLEMTDDDIEYFIAYDIGDHVENPFYNSLLENKIPEKEIENIIYDEIINDDLLNIIDDVDFIIPDE